MLVNYFPDAHEQIISALFAGGKTAYAELKNLAPMEKGGFNFLYLPSPDAIHGDFKASDFIELYGRLSGVPKDTINDVKHKLGTGVTDSLFKELNKNDRIRVLLAIALLKPRDHYFFDDIPAGSQSIPGDDTSDIMRDLKTLISSNATIVRLKTNCWPDEGDCHLRVSYLDGKFLCKPFKE